jgi:rhodanese-related sulfurtransferase
MKIQKFIAACATTLMFVTACSSATPTAAPAASNGATTVKVTVPREINVSEASKLRDQGAYILDVREQSEWDEFHMPGATLIPLGTLPSKLASVPKDKPVVVVCRSGNRSQSGRDILLNAGYTNVTSMSGGMLAWQSAGLPIAKGR